MSYPEWTKEIQRKLEQKYKIRNMTESKFGLRIDFYNSFRYSVEHAQLERLYYYSVSDAVRSEDGFEHICNDIEEKYLKQIIK
ncbi:MAG: hypothetical protein HFH64_09650 [Lachnospiraceae bacterium]|nr:hypothetical protein [Lachnospiraceae bacterium]